MALLCWAVSKQISFLSYVSVAAERPVLERVKFFPLVLFPPSDFVLFRRTTKLMKTQHYSSQSRPREALWDPTGRYWMLTFLTGRVLATEHLTGPKSGRAGDVQVKNRNSTKIVLFVIRTYSQLQLASKCVLH